MKRSPRPKIEVRMALIAMAVGVDPGRALHMSVAEFVTLKKHVEERQRS